MMMTVMPTWPVIEASVVRTVDWPVIAVPVIGIAIAVVVTMMVVDAPEY
jgi:hypothetical protein